MHPRGLFSLAEHLDRLSKDGDPLKVLEGTAEFERVRPALVEGLDCSGGAKSGRPPFDLVAMFEVLVVQAQHNLSNARTAFMIRDLLSSMRSFDFDLRSTMPYTDIICDYRSWPTTIVTLEALMQAFEQQLCEARHLPMGAQVVDATLLRAPKQRNTEDEKAAIKAGKPVKQMLRGRLIRAHQKNVDGRWTVKIGGKFRYRHDGTPLPHIAMPMFAYKSHISIDRRFGLDRKAAVISAADSDGRQIRLMIDPGNTASNVWGGRAYRRAVRTRHG